MGVVPLIRNRLNGKNAMSTDAIPMLTRFSLLCLLSLVIADDPCPNVIYLEAGKRQTVPCTFEDFQVIGWINGISEARLPVISLQNSEKRGPGYDNGQYDISENGSLIINNVTLSNDFNYTVLHVSLQGLSTYYRVRIKVFVFPVPKYPVVNGLTSTSHVVLDVYEEGLLNCSMNRIRPSVSVEWILPSDDIVLHSTHYIEDNNDGTFNTTLVSTFTFTNKHVDRVTLQCKVGGSEGVLFPSVTTVDILLQEKFPVVNGRANQQQVVLNVKSEDELTCSMDKIPKDVSLEWIIDTPSLPDVTFVQEEASVRENGDQTVNITRKLKIAIKNNIPHATISCTPSSKSEDKSLHSTEVIILFPKAPPVPVIDGCHSHQSDCSVVMVKGEQVTCSAINVPSLFDNAQLTIDADSGVLSLAESTLNYHYNGDYDIISSYQYSAGEQSVVQIRCLLTVTQNISQLEFTATAQIILQETYQSHGGTRSAVIILLIISIGLTIGLYIMLKWLNVKQRRDNCLQRGRSDKEHNGVLKSSVNGHCRVSIPISDVSLTDSEE